MPPLTVSSRSVTSTSRRSATRPRVIVTQARAAHATGALQCSLIPGARSPSPTLQESCGSHCRRGQCCCEVHHLSTNVHPTFTESIPYRTIPSILYWYFAGRCLRCGAMWSGATPWVTIPRNGSGVGVHRWCPVSAIETGSGHQQTPTTQARPSVLSWRRPFWVQLRFFSPNAVGNLSTVLCQASVPLSLTWVGLHTNGRSGTRLKEISGNTKLVRFFTFLVDWATAHWAATRRRPATMLTDRVWHMDMCGFEKQLAHLAQKERHE